MNTYKSNKTISEQFDNLNKLPLFEIPVIDKRTQDDEYIIFNISIQDNKFRAEHIALNRKQENSDKIAFCSVNLDSFLTLDQNLQDLYNECINAIINSTFYELSE
jgi:hypothetical protein